MIEVSRMQEDGMQKIFEKRCAIDLVFLLFLSFFFQLDEAIILFISFSKKDHRFLYACLDARKDDKNEKTKKRRMD